MRPKRVSANVSGLTLTETVISVAILSILMGMAAWLAKGSVVFRIGSEKRLNLAVGLQKVMFRIENDLLSARRHTLGNVLGNNVPCQSSGGLPYFTSSDPGFDLFLTSLTADPLDRSHWFAPAGTMIPRGIGLTPGVALANIERTPRDRFHGTGILALATDRTGYYAVRSPDFTLVSGRRYVMAGWMRGDVIGAGLTTLTPQIALQTTFGNGDPGSDVFLANGPASPDWMYVTFAFTAPGMGPYNLYLRSNTAGTIPTTFLSGFFDSITITPAGIIADIDFLSARGHTSPANVNLNENFNLGMVFHITNTDPTPISGGIEELKYIFADGDQRTFPVVNPDLLRYRAEIPMDLNRLAEPVKLQTLPNISRLTVAWVGDETQGANRPIRVTVTMRDRIDGSKTLRLSRVLFPPTD